MSVATVRANTALFLWGAAVVAAVCWPFLLPGEFLWRDMVLIDAPSFSPQAFGSGALPARNVPQDGLLAFAGLIGAGALLARLLIFVTAIGAAVVAAKWARSTWGAVAAIPVAVANPFIIERLLQGQWSLAIAGWCLPIIAYAGLHGHTKVKWLAMWLASLTPTGAIFGLLTGVVCARQRRGWTATFGIALCLPWVLPGLLATMPDSDAAAAVAAFAPRAEEGAGTLGALLGLGGIWNAGAVPESRTMGFAIAGIVLAGFAFWGAWKRRDILPQLGGLAAMGLGGAVLIWLAPQLLEALIDAVPGAGLLRDGQKLVALAIPLYVAGVGALDKWPAVLALCAALLQAPDAPREVAVLAPRETGVDERLVADIGKRVAFFPERPNLVDVEGAPAVDPYSKAVPMVESGELVVDGAVVDAASPLYAEVAQAWDEGDIDKLRELGVGVVVDGENLVDTGAGEPSVPWGLTLLWAVLPSVLAIPTRRQSARR